MVYGQDKTAMNWALVRNYLGISEILGTEFQKVARAQVAGFGVTIHDESVETIEATADGYRITVAGGATVTAKYVVLSEGKTPKLAKQLGLEFDEKVGIATDKNAKSRLDGVYVVGRSSRPGRSQAIISAGDGAAAAIDIISREQSTDFADWDSPPKQD